MSSVTITGAILASTHLNFPSISDYTHISKLHNPIYGRRTRIGIQCSSSSPDFSSIAGGALDFQKATTSLSSEQLPSPKKITLVRHGLSSWNAESRVQGSSDLSVLTDEGAKQAERCRKALANIHFDKCFASPITRAKSTAEILWQGRKEPLIYYDSLKEVHLFLLEGMKNGQFSLFSDRILLII